MARSLTASAPAGLAGRSRARRRPGSSAAAAAASVRPLAFTGTLARRAWHGRRLRRTVIAALVALGLLGGGWVWLRHSPLAAVRHVEIVGVHGPDAQAVDDALTRAARGMSTLDLNVGALRAAVAPLHIVRELRASASFPHGLRIDVVEQLPVAALTTGAARTALAADGVALGGALLSGALPSVSGAAVPAVGRRVSASGLLEELAVLGAAPWQLAVHAQQVFTGAMGITVTMHGGLTVYFGNDQSAHAKWLSLARVLADPSSAGASYVDVRLPSHPAAGFPPGAVPESVASASASPQSTEEGTVAAIAAGLPAASATGAPTGTSTGSTPDTGASAGAGGSAQGQGSATTTGGAEATGTDEASPPQAGAQGGGTTAPEGSDTP